MGEFYEWLVDSGYVTDVDQIEYELSSEELDRLYLIYSGD